jgi:hypothetical protein
MATKVRSVCLIKTLKLRSSAAEALPVAVAAHPHTLHTSSVANSDACFLSYKYTKQNLSQEASSSSPTHNICCIVLNLNVHYRVHNSLQIVPILCQMNPVRALPSLFS